MCGDAGIGVEPGGELRRVADVAAVVGDHAAVGAERSVAQPDGRPEPRQGRGQAEGEELQRYGPLSAWTGLLESAITMNRSAAAATIFSRGVRRRRP